LRKDHLKAVKKEAKRGLGQKNNVRKERRGELKRQLH